LAIGLEFGGFVAWGVFGGAVVPDLTGALERSFTFIHALAHFFVSGLAVVHKPLKIGLCALFSTCIPTVGCSTIQFGAGTLAVVSTTGKEQGASDGKA
jgi:hypothetical protein